MKFLVSGEVGLNEWRKFSKEVEAETPAAARERVYALFGANNRVKRSKVKISSVTKV